jgi:hypothetical protein
MDAGRAACSARLALSVRLEEWLVGEAVTPSSSAAWLALAWVGGAGRWLVGVAVVGDASGLASIARFVAGGG